jgi:glucoamylase
MSASSYPVRVVRTALGLVFLWAAFSTIVSAAEPTLDSWIRTESDVARERLLANVSPAGVAKGAVIASPSKQNPNYYFHWTRDAALTMNVIVTLSEQDQAQRQKYREMLRQYAAFSRANQLAALPGGSPEKFGPGEPKFSVDGVVETNWGRPQNDGPALRTITLIRFAQGLLDEGDRAYVATLYDGKLPTDSVIKADLEYVAHHWPDSDIELWEEMRGHHFYARLVQHRALLDGARFADQMGDGGAARFYRSEAKKLEPEIEKHWDANRVQLVATREVEGNDFKPSQLDACVVLAAIHTDSPCEPFFAPTDDRILATALKLSQTFREMYGVNKVRADAAGRALQPAIGRYPEDKWDGYQRADNTLGNPWFINTAAMAELCYRAAISWAKAGKVPVTPLNIEFLKSAVASEGSMVTLAVGDLVPRDDPRFRRLINALCELGDGYLRRIQRHCDQTTGSLSEELNRDTGIMQGAADLTWSYAAVLTAFQQRAIAKNEAQRLEPQPAPTGKARRSLLLRRFAERPRSPHFEVAAL